MNGEQVISFHFSHQSLSLFSHLALARSQSVQFLISSFSCQVVTYLTVQAIDFLSRLSEAIDFLSRLSEAIDISSRLSQAIDHSVEPVELLNTIDYPRIEILSTTGLSEASLTKVYDQ